MCDILVEKVSAFTKRALDCNTFSDKDLRGYVDRVIASEILDYIRLPYLSYVFKLSRKLYHQGQLPFAKDALLSLFCCLIVVVSNPSII